jgi:hypothetical protein
MAPAVLSLPCSSAQEAYTPIELPGYSTASEPGNALALRTLFEAWNAEADVLFGMTIDALHRAFGTPVADLQYSIEESLPDSGDGPYLYVQVFASLPVDQALERLDAFDEEFWIEHRSALPFVRIRLRFRDGV